MGREAIPEALGGFVRRMERFDQGRDGPVREIMARLGDRWSTLFLIILSTGTYRHAELRRVVDAISGEKAISQRMLTLRLRTLERNGLIGREERPGPPKQVSYFLTPLGRELFDRVDGLLAWIEANHGRILESRRAFGPE